MGLRLNCAATLAAACLAPTNAAADTAPSSTLGSIARAVGEEGIAAPAPNGAVDLPDAATDAAALAVGGGKQLTMEVPGRGPDVAGGSTALFNGAADGTAVAVQSTSQGLRALVSIDSAAAPER